MNILIVEDDLLIAEMLKEMLEELEHTICDIKSSYDDVFLYLDSSNHQPDLLFLDINLEQVKDGIDIAYQLQTNYKIPFIYLTSYADPKTIKNASVTLPEAYLTKPFNQTQLLATLEIVKQKIKSSTITIKDGTKIVTLKYSNICYLKSDKNYLEIYTVTNKRYTIRKSFDSFLNNELNNLFIRVHRSYVVNISHIKNVSVDEITINQFSVPLSRNYKKQLLAIYQK